jgi:CBS domain-containing protein
MKDLARPLPERRVADIMQSHVITLAPDLLARQAARILFERDITGAPVVENGQVLGLVSASDLLRLLAYGPEAELMAEGDGSDAEERGTAPEPTVRDLMLPATFHVETTTTLPKLASFLLHAGVHRALVMDHGRLAGIVSTTDLLRAVAGEWRKPPDRR